MKLPLISLFLLALIGCASLGHPISEKDAAQILVGKTTREELIRICGHPRYAGLNATTNGTQEVFTWLYQPTDRQLAIFLGASSPQAQSINVLIGTNGIVESFAVETSERQGPTHAVLRSSRLDRMSSRGWS